MTGSGESGQPEQPQGLERALLRHDDFAARHLLGDRSRAFVDGRLARMRPVLSGPGGKPGLSSRRLAVEVGMRYLPLAADIGFRPWLGRTGDDLYPAKWINRLGADLLHLFEDEEDLLAEAAAPRAAAPISSAREAVRLARAQQAPADGRRPHRPIGPSPRLMKRAARLASLANRVDRVAPGFSATLQEASHRRAFTHLASDAADRAWVALEASGVTRDAGDEGQRTSSEPAIGSAPRTPVLPRLSALGGAPVVPGSRAAQQARSLTQAARSPYPAGVGRVAAFSGLISARPTSRALAQVEHAMARSDEADTEDRFVATPARRRPMLQLAAAAMGLSALDLVRHLGPDRASDDTDGAQAAGPDASISGVRRTRSVLVDDIVVGDGALPALTTSLQQVARRDAATIRGLELITGPSHPTAQFVARAQRRIAPERLGIGAVDRQTASPRAARAPDSLPPVGLGALMDRPLGLSPAGAGLERVSPDTVALASAEGRPLGAVRRAEALAAGESVALRMTAGLPASELISIAMPDVPADSALASGLLGVDRDPGAPDSATQRALTIAGQARAASALAQAIRLRGEVARSTHAPVQAPIAASRAGTAEPVSRPTALAAGRQRAIDLGLAQVAPGAPLSAGGGETLAPRRDTPGQRTWQMFSPAKAVSLSLLLSSGADDVAPLADAAEPEKAKIARVARLGLALAEGRRALRDWDEQALATPAMRVATAFGTVDLERTMGGARALRLAEVPTTTHIQMFHEERVAPGAHADPEGWGGPVGLTTATAPRPDLAPARSPLSALPEIAAAMRTPTVGRATSRLAQIQLAALRPDPETIAGLATAPRAGLPMAVRPPASLLGLTRGSGARPGQPAQTALTDGAAWPEAADGERDLTDHIWPTVTHRLSRAPMPLIDTAAADASDAPRPRRQLSFADSAVLEMLAIPDRVRVDEPGGDRPADPGAPKPIDRPTVARPIVSRAAAQTSPSLVMALAPGVAARGATQFGLSPAQARFVEPSPMGLRPGPMSAVARGRLATAEGSLGQARPTMVEVRPLPTALREQATAAIAPVPPGRRAEQQRSAIGGDAAIGQVRGPVADRTPVTLGAGIPGSRQRADLEGPGSLAQRVEAMADSTRGFAGRPTAMAAAAARTDLVSLVQQRPLGVEARFRPGAAAVHDDSVDRGMAPSRRPELAAAVSLALAAPSSAVADAPGQPAAEAMRWAGGLLAEAKRVAFRATEEVRSSGRVLPPTERAVRRVMSLADEIADKAPAGRAAHGALLPFLVRIEAATKQAKAIERLTQAGDETPIVSDRESSAPLRVAQAERQMLGMVDYHAQLSGAVDGARDAASLAPLTSTAFAATQRAPSSEATPVLPRTARPSVPRIGQRLLHMSAGVFDPKTGLPRLAGRRALATVAARTPSPRTQLRVTEKGIRYVPVTRDVSPQERRAEVVTRRYDPLAAQGTVDRTLVAAQAEGSGPTDRPVRRAHAIRALDAAGLDVSTLRDAVTTAPTQASARGASRPVKRTISGMVGRIIEELKVGAMPLERPSVAALSAVDLGMDSLVAPGAAAGVEAGLPAPTLDAPLMGLEATTRGRLARKSQSADDAARIDDLVRAGRLSAAVGRRGAGIRARTGTFDAVTADRDEIQRQPVSAVTQQSAMDEAALVAGMSGLFTDGPGERRESDSSLRWLEKELSSLVSGGRDITTLSQVSVSGRAAGAAERMLRYLDDQSEDSGTARAGSSRPSPGGELVSQAAIRRVTSPTGQTRRGGTRLGRPPVERRPLYNEVQGEPVQAGRQFVEPWAGSAVPETAPTAPLARTTGSGSGSGGADAQSAEEAGAPPQDKLASMADEIFEIIKDKLDLENARLGR